MKPGMQIAGAAPQPGREDAQDAEPQWAKDLRRELVEMARRLLQCEQALANARRTAPTAATPMAGAHISAALHEKLRGLTLKRHAVLTAVLGGVGYQELAKITEWDVSTVKLQLRAAMDAFGITTRERLLVQHGDLLDAVLDDEYQRLYGLSKRWWIEPDANLLAVLRTTRRSANQYTSSNRKRT